MGTILVGSALVLLAPAFAAAQVTCGDTIGKGQTVTLTADIGPCDTDPTIPPPGIETALKVEGGTLDLGGHTLTCADTDGDGRSALGIWLTGENSTVMNGTIVGCWEGLYIGAGDGRQDSKHRVQHVTVQASETSAGVIISSNKNTLIDIRATDSQVRPGAPVGGIQIFGDKNTLIGLVATGNSGIGIQIDGKKNKIISATATGNAGLGFSLYGAGNKLRACDGSGNAFSGFEITGGKNEIIGATGSGNGGSGFHVLDVYGTANEIKLTACHASGNAASGFRIAGRKNKVDDSVADSNAAYGFVFDTAQNRVRGGAAYDNGSFDLADCYGNKVSDLEHGTESSDCP